MKKITAFILTVIIAITAFTLPVLANSANKSFGNVPEATGTITVDGLKDAAYNSGLQIKIDIPEFSEGGTDGFIGWSALSTTVSGTAWVLWQKGFLYVFCSVTDPTVIPQSQYTDESDIPWATDSVEVFLDPNNNTTDPYDSTAIQYRIDAYGFLSFENRMNGTSSYGQDSSAAKGIFEGAAKITKAGYDVEFIIPITASMNNELGFEIQINDLQDDGTRVRVFPEISMIAGEDQVSSDNIIWYPAMWDYIVLTATTPAATTPAPSTATPTSSSVLVNGTTVSFDAYNINGNNYFKLRDLASVLSGTGKQFDVTWDAAVNTINLVSGQAYTPVGGEMASKGSGNQTATLTTSTIYLNGAPVALTAYNIGGNNYFKLRDIGQALDFGVAWDGATNTITIDTSTGYTAG